MAATLARRSAPVAPGSSPPTPLRTGPLSANWLPSFLLAIAGTLYVPGKREPLRFGLGNPEEMARYSSIPALFLVPFVDLARSLRSRVRELAAAWK